MDNNNETSSTSISSSRKIKVNYKLLPIKAHYFFFMASLGPILPFLPVFGKQLGVSEVVMGFITAILPILFLLAKPLFGLIVDYFQEQRKTVFMGLLCAMSLCYVLLYLIPQPSGPFITEKSPYNLSGIHCEELDFCQSREVLEAEGCGQYKRVICNLTCGPSKNGSLVEALFTSAPTSNDTSSAETPCIIGNQSSFTCSSVDNSTCELACVLHQTEREKDCLYGTPTFWGFVILMSLGTIGFNVANSISDAICFDVLGSGGEMKYGHQRVWGTIGFGITALLAGYAVDWWSAGSANKDYTPAFILVLIFGVLDILCCFRLRVRGIVSSFCSGDEISLPPIPRSENILKDVGQLLKHKHIVIFLTFAVLAGVIDSFIVYFLFWYLEDLAQVTGEMSNIKLLEGITVAVETLVGEVIFFMLSGKILKKIGYGHSLTLCFMAYSLRLGLISLIPSPWWVLPVELFMQGPTYALCYTTIVAYASAVAPPGTSATMQGLVAGMDDGFAHSNVTGYALGSMIGGLLYHEVEGNMALKIFCAMAFLCGLLHFVLYKFTLKHTMLPAG
ncbi:hypothetical protein ANN_20127 [Periplaneta americana]|uniref:Major facilitator superfamily (MFS) profile domain-containing protein n=1 Tax=Periplaneta americana TaxID=6978 RepID=A0ABQ8SBS9_PERAM|nr:hypothetical protein ANN_20127 [Periplaneta americana]